MDNEQNFVMLTANAGVLVQYHGKKILIDALHDRYTRRFSSVPDELLEEIAEGRDEFADVDLMVYTHDHPDHYSERWTRRFLQHHPQTELVSPILDFAGSDKVHVLDAESENMLLAGIMVETRKLTHEGAQYAGIPNYGFVFEIDGFRIATFGDAAFDKKSIGALIGGRPVDLAIMNFPYITLHRGREIITEVIRPKEILAVHLPYEEKDQEGYIRATKGSARRNTELPKTRLMYEQLQKEKIG